MREALADAVAGLLQTVEPQHAITLTKDQIRNLLAAAKITTLIWSQGVEYDYRGEPIKAHMPEMPTRFAKQLTQVIRGGVALGMTIEEASVSRFAVHATRCRRSGWRFSRTCGSTHGGTRRDCAHG